MPDTVRYLVDGPLAAVVLDRPEAHNALDTVTKVALRDALEEAAGDSSVRAVLLTGTGRAFCTGQDLKEHAQALERGGEALGDTIAEHYEPITLALAGMPKPVVAAVNGVAAGAGAAFAFACDVRLAAASARFSTSFAKVGLSADSGMSWTLRRLVGAGRAAEMLLLDEPVTADRALAVGLVSRVLPDEGFAAAAEAVARQLADGPTSAFATVKAALAGEGADTLAGALAVEREGQRALGATADHREAVRAFLAKERPRFTGA